MAEIVLHFRNRRNEDVTATVQTPIVIRFRNAQGKQRVVVRNDTDVRSIILSADIKEPANAKHGEGPPGLLVEPDEGPVSLAAPTADSSPPPPPPGGGPGVCYEEDQQVFCW